MNATEEIVFPLESIPITSNARFSLPECETLSVSAQKTATSFSMLVGTSSDECRKKRISKGALIGIVVGGVVATAVLIGAGIFAFKKGLLRSAFRSEEDSHIVN